MNQIIIDGVEYVPKTSVVSQETLTALNKVYLIAFAFGVYDPCCDYGEKRFKEIFDLLLKVDDELKFKL